MSPSGLFSGGFGVKILIGLVSLLIGIGGWSAQRICGTLDNHELRLQATERATERAVVQLQTVAEDVKEIKADNKRSAEDIRKIMVQVGVK